MKNKQTEKKSNVSIETIKGKEIETVIPTIAPEEPKNEELKTEEKIETPVVEGANVAVVFNGKFEVRRYSLSVHGEDFLVLADEFANKKDYRIELIKE